MAAKFKVGDRVLVKSSPYSLRENEKSGSITGATTTGRGNWRVLLDNYNEDLGFFEHEIEHVAPPAMFKVGDRVRATADAPKGEIGVIFVEDGDEPRYLVKFDKWTDGHGEGGREWWLDTGELESAPLTIVAGRYYKMRDGRRVGPMYELGDNFIEVVGDARLWGKDGVGQGAAKGEDPIAEWPDDPEKAIEPAKRPNVAAQVDTIADEYGAGAKPKFRVGDRVVVTNNVTIGGFPIVKYVVGDTYTITDVVKDNLGNDAVMLNGHFQYLRADQFMVVSSTPAIVALIENGQPKPAKRPYVHPNRAAAETEAKRLAGKHPGGEFGVYEFVSSAKEAKTYAHEWQRLAAKGDKDGAIDRLISDAGISRMDAHSAVRRFAA